MSDTEYISKDAFITQQRKRYCENCERRKGIKNGGRIFVYEIGEAPCRAYDIEDMIDEVWDFPPADVAPVVHGRWTNYYFHPCGNRGKCSVCGEDNIPTNYCPNCGAKMDKDEREG